MNVTVIQPKYFSGENPDEKIAKFIIEELEKVPKGGLIVAPTYSIKAEKLRLFTINSIFHHRKSSLVWKEEMLQVNANACAS